MLSMVWGWAVLACPIAFVAGFIWIGRAKDLDEPVEGVPSAGEWFTLSLFALVLTLLLGGVLFIFGIGHGSSRAIWPSLVMFALVVGPFAYCIFTYRWIAKIRRQLKARQPKSL